MHSSVSGSFGATQKTTLNKRRQKGGYDPGTCIEYS